MKAVSGLLCLSYDCLMVMSVAYFQVSSILRMGRLYEPMFWLATSASGVLGFLIAWASTRQIEYTSPITHHISNNTKSILQVSLKQIHDILWLYQVSIWCILFPFYMQTYWYYTLERYNDIAWIMDMLDSIASSLMHQDFKDNLPRI